MNFLDSVIQSYHYYADKVPLEIFTFVGAFVEEVIAPIPSPLVLTLAGSVAQSQGFPAIYLLWISVIGALGKTLGALLLYTVTDKAEDLILVKFGKFLGITHDDVKKFSSQLSGGRKDDFIFFLMRAIPIFPSAPISIVCGLIKFNFKSFVTWTFFGSIIRNLIFLWLGYFGLASTESIIHGLDKVESVMQIVIVLLLGAGIAWMYSKRSSKSDPLKLIKKFFKK